MNFRAPRLALSEAAVLSPSACCFPIVILAVAFLAAIFTSQVAFSQAVPLSIGSSQASAALSNGQVHANTQSVAKDSVIAVSGVPDENTRYRMFFGFLSAMEDFADKLATDGNASASAAWRAHVQRVAGLTDAENAAMKSVASDFNRLLADKDEQVKTAVDNMRAQRADANLQRVPTADDVSKLELDRIQLTESYLSQLKTQLGPDSFTKLDTFVQDLYQSSSTISARKRTDSNATPLIPRGSLAVGGAQ